MKNIPTLIQHDFEIFRTRVFAGLGFCFLDALTAIRSEGLVCGWVLVHGLAEGALQFHGTLLVHAWLECKIDDEVWFFDPSLGVLMKSDGFVAGRRCVYTKKQAMLLLREKDHCGPWDNELMEHDWRVKNG